MKLLPILVMLFLTSLVSASGWSQTSYLVNGLPTLNTYSTLSVFYNFSGNNKWNSIAGEWAGVFTGYQWDGTTWSSNSSIASGLDDVGYRSAPAVVYNFSGNTNWTLISGDSDGTFFGFQWNGTSWVQNTSLISGLGDIGGYSTPSIVYNFSGNNKWTMISGEYNGVFVGFQWNGTSWVSNTSLVSGLIDVGYNAYPSLLFNFSGTSDWKLISGNDEGIFYGFQWNGTSWVQNTSIVDGLEDIGSALAFSTPYAVNNFSSSNHWNLFTGRNDGIFLSYSYGSLGSSATIQPSNADNYVDSKASLQSTNYGTEIYLTVGGSTGSPTPIRRSIIMFDISSLPSGITITSANLSLYIYQDSGNLAFIDVHALNQSAWTETGSTWLNYNTTNTWASAGGDYNLTNESGISYTEVNLGWYNWSVKDSLQRFVNSGINYGWLLRQRDETNVKWVRLYSREYATTSLRPKLAISYSDLQPPRWYSQSQNASSISQGEAIKLSANWTDNIELNTAVLSTNESGSWVNYTSLYGSPLSLSGTTAWSNFTWQNSSITGPIGWRIWTRDFAGNWNATGIMNFTAISTGDSQAPQWSSQTENVSTAYVGQAIKLSAYWTDNVNLSTALLSTNSSGTWVNNSGRYGSPFAFTSNASFSNFTWANASIGVGTYGWQIWANDTSNNWNVTNILTFNITSNSTLQFSVNQTIYPQGRSPGMGYDVYIPFQARYLDYAGSPITGATCAVTNNETTDSISLSYNVTSGNYTGSLNNYQLYDIVSFTANCSKTLYDSAGASTTTNVWWYNYLTEEANKTYDGGVSTTHWLEKEPTSGSAYNLSITAVMPSGVNDHGLVGDFIFPFSGSGMNYSFLKHYHMSGLHTLRLNMSVNDTTCQPLLCLEIEDQFGSEIYKQCSPTQALAANTPTLIEANLTGLAYSIDQGYYLTEELYLNCTSPVTELVNIYYNYSGEPANIEIHSPRPLQLTTMTVAFQQIEPGYVIGPNQTANITGKAWITFNNTIESPQYLDYYYLVPIDVLYWNDNLAANTSYIYNSTGGLWASDNASAGAPHAAILYPATKQVRWTTETIPNGTAVNETVQGLIKDALRNSETLLYSDAYKKRWQANTLTIFSQLVKATTTLTNTTTWTNFSTYGVQSNWKFSVNLTNTTGTYDITSQTTIDPATGKMTFPTANLSGDYAYTVEASTFAITNLTIAPDDDPGTPGFQVNPVSCSNKTITINMSFSGYPASCNVSLFDSAHSFASPNYVPTFTMNGNNCIATQDLTYYALNGTWNATTQTTNGIVVTNSTTFTYNTLSSIAVNNTPIQFSSGYPSTSVNATVGNGYPMNVNNCGNIAYSLFVSGTNMTGMTNPSYQIDRNQIKYGQAIPPTTSLPGTPAPIGSIAVQSYSPLYWALNIPASVIAQQYDGTVTFS